MKQSGTQLQLLGRRFDERKGKASLRAVAEEIGVSPATLSRVQRGFVPDLETFTKICQWLKEDPSTFLGGGGSTPSQPRVSVHFRKSAALTPETAQALSAMVMSAYNAWLREDGEDG